MATKYKFVVELTDMSGQTPLTDRQVAWEIKEAMQDRKGFGRFANFQVKSLRRIKAWSKGYISATTQAPQEFGALKLEPTVIAYMLANLEVNRLLLSGQPVTEKTLNDLIVQHLQSNASSKSSRSTRRNSKGVIRDHLKKLTQQKTNS